MQTWKMNIVNKLSEKTKKSNTINLFETAVELGYKDILIGETQEIIDAFLQVNFNYKVNKTHEKGMFENSTNTYLFPIITFTKLTDEELDKKNNLNKIRKNKGYSQSKLAELSGVNIRLIQKYESGERNFKKAQVQTAIKIAIALQVTVEELFLF